MESPLQQSVNQIIKEIGLLTLNGGISDAEEKLRNYVQENHPAHVLIASDKDLQKPLTGEYVWLVHILDGSMNLKRGVPYFGTGIAIARPDISKELEIIYSAIYLPTTDELITAEKGKGAFINNKLVHVSSQKSLKGCLGSIAPTMDKFMAPVLKSLAVFSETKDFRLESEGAGVFHIRYLISGSRDFWAFEHDPSLRPIHNVTSAASLIIKEAGGKVTTLKGDPWKLGGYSFLASNGLIHDELITVLNAKS